MLTDLRKQADVHRWKQAYVNIVYNSGLELSETLARTIN